jgi:hypothetical protein
MRVLQPRQLRRAVVAARAARLRGGSVHRGKQQHHIQGGNKVPGQEPGRLPAGRQRGKQRLVGTRPPTPQAQARTVIARGYASNGRPVTGQAARMPRRTSGKRADVRGEGERGADGRGQEGRKHRGGGGGRGGVRGGGGWDATEKQGGREGGAWVKEGWWGVGRWGHRCACGTELPPRDVGDEVGAVQGARGRRARGRTHLQALQREHVWRARTAGVCQVPGEGRQGRQGGYQGRQGRRGDRARACTRNTRAQQTRARAGARRRREAAACAAEQQHAGGPARARKGTARVGGVSKVSVPMCGRLGMRGDEGVHTCARVRGRVGGGEAGEFGHSPPPLTYRLRQVAAAQWGSARRRPLGRGPAPRCAGAPPGGRTPSAPD